MIEPTKDYCNDCGYLTITERGQRINKSKDPHICKLLNKRVLHNGRHPLLVRLKDCPTVFNEQ